jgi:hypothetical protein
MLKRAAACSFWMQATATKTTTGNARERHLCAADTCAPVSEHTLSRSTLFRSVSRLRLPPEDGLSGRDIELLSDPRTFRPWNGPNGYDPPTAVSRARATRRALPDAPLGELIGQFRYGDCPGQAAAPFLIGERATDLEVPCSGALWLCVNDVVFQPDPDLYFADNVGFFVVDVSLQ